LAFQKKLVNAAYMVPATLDENSPSSGTKPNLPEAKILTQNNTLAKPEGALRAPPQFWQRNHSRASSGGFPRSQLQSGQSGMNLTPLYHKRQGSLEA